MDKKVNRKKQIKNLKLAFKYALKEKKYFILYFLAYILLLACGIIVPLLSAKQLLKLNNGLLMELIYVSVFIFIFEILRNVGNFFVNKYAHLFSREVLKNIQLDLAREVLRMETSDLDKKSSGIIIDRIVKDSNKVADAFIELNFNFGDVITSLGILVAVFVINKWIFLFFVIALILSFFIDRIRINKRNEADKLFRHDAEEATGLVGELVRGVRDVKVLNAEDSFMERISDKITLVNQEKYNMNKINRKYRFIGGSISDIEDLVFILISCLMIHLNKLSIANFIIIYMYQYRIYNLQYVVVRLMEWFKDFNLSSERVFEIINDDVYKKEVFGSKHIKKIKGDFEFRNVSFGYDTNKEVLKDLSFKIKHNETVSFVGKSGAGKSTIFSLLAKLYSPTSGNIFIDGININELDKDSIRGNISIITQNPYIFNMTIKDNFKIIKNDITDEEIVKVCKASRLDEFIESLPDKYDTLVGEGGVNLSGGQRQRLAIARALAQKTEIILFDEATSALDNETQNKIQEAINGMKNEYTILIIAHRLSTVINSDKIMVIDDGKVIDSGTHEELLKSNEEYKKLYNMELKRN